MKVFSFDAETNGLDGKAWAIAATVRENGVEVAQFVARCPIVGETNEWVRDNVLPAVEDLAETHSSFEGMLADFASFYKKHKSGALVIYHCGNTVEGGHMRYMRDMDLLSAFDGPYLENEYEINGEPVVVVDVLDVQGVLMGLGENPGSVEAYVRKYGLELGKVPGTTHHPLYDSVVAAVVFEHCAGRIGLARV